MVRIRWAATAGQTGLISHEFLMIAVAQPKRFGEKTAGVRKFCVTAPCEGARSAYVRDGGSTRYARLPIKKITTSSKA
jgi:hypothetical protein